MKKGKFPLWGILLIIAILFGSVGAIFWYLSVQPEKKQSFLIELKKLDGQIGGGFFDLAQDNLPSVTSLAKNTKQWKRALKRAYYISYYQKDFELLYKESLKALKRNKESQDILPFFITAALETRRYEEALESSLKLKDSKWDALKGKVLLHTDPMAIVKTKGDNQVNLLLGEGGGLSVNILEDVARKTKDDRLWFDVVLLSAQSGNRDKTIEYLNHIKEKTAFSSYLSMIYWDLGHFTKSLYYLDRTIDRYPSRLEYSQMKADLSTELGNLDDSEMLYKSIISRNPEYNWRSYYNLALLYQEKEDWDKLEEVLYKGLDIYPHEEALYLFLIETLIYTGQNVEARELIKTYSDNTEVELVEIKWYPGIESLEKRSARLWQLYNRDQSKEGVLEYLLWHLLTIGNLADLDLALEIGQRRFGKQWWILYYQALSKVLSNEPEESIGLFQEVLSLQPNNPYAMLNLGLLWLKTGNYDGSINILHQCGDILEGRDSNRRLLSKLHTLLGQNYFAIQEFDKSALEINLALEYDSGNLSAEILQAELERR